MAKCTVDLILLLFVVGAISIAYSQSNCVNTPPQWMAFIRQVAFQPNASHNERFVFRISLAAYDRNAGKFSIGDIISLYGRPLTEEIFDFKAGKLYSIIGRSNGTTCTVSRLSGSIPSFGVPSTATYRSTQYIGAKNITNLGVLVNEYSEISSNNYYFSSYAPFKGNECIPVLFTNITLHPNPSIDIRYYADLATRLDPDSFDIPDVCP